MEDSGRRCWHSWGNNWCCEHRARRWQRNKDHATVFGVNEDGTRRFEYGENVVLRYITRFDSRAGMSWPYRVVEDQDDLVALYIPKGAQYARWGRPPAPGAPRGPLELDGWRRDVLRLM